MSYFIYKALSRTMTSFCCSSLISHCLLNPSVCGDDLKWGKRVEDRCVPSAEGHPVGYSSSFCAVVGGAKQTEERTGLAPGSVPPWYLIFFFVYADTGPSESQWGNLMGSLAFLFIFLHKMTSTSTTTERCPGILLWISQDEARVCVCVFPIGWSLRAPNSLAPCRSPGGHSGLRFGWGHCLTAG